MAVEWIAVQRLGMEHKLSASGLCCWGRHRPLAAELVRGTCLALANALDLRGVQRVDLGSALAVILKTHPHRQSEQVGEAFLESIIAGDLAADVADDAAEPNAQELEFAPGPLEL